MRAKEFLLEYRDASLYHATTPASAVSIWAKGGFRPNSSFTRMWTYAHGYALGMNRLDHGYAIFSLDLGRIKQDLGRRALYGYDWFDRHQPDDAGNYQPRNWGLDTDRAEERNRVAIPVPKYLHKLQIWLPVRREVKPEIEKINQSWDDEGRPGWQKTQHLLNTNPDAYYNYIPEPMNLNDAEQRAWEEMQRDSRVEIKTGRFGNVQQGVKINPRVQYDQDHPAYGK